MMPPIRIKCSVFKHLQGALITCTTMNTSGAWKTGEDLVGIVVDVDAESMGTDEIYRADIKILTHYGIKIASHLNRSVRVIQLQDHPEYKDPLPLWSGMLANDLRLMHLAEMKKMYRELLGVCPESG